MSKHFKVPKAYRVIGGFLRSGENDEIGVFDITLDSKQSFFVLPVNGKDGNTFPFLCRTYPDFLPIMKWNRSKHYFGMMNVM